MYLDILEKTTSATNGSLITNKSEYYKAQVFDEFKLKIEYFNTFEIRQIIQNKSYLKFKRIFDVIFASFFLIVLSPLMLLVSLIILLIDHQLPIFKQRRYGLNGKFFTIYKFHSVKKDKMKKVVFKVGTNQENMKVLIKNKGKGITKVGKFLRATSIDELPQLFNILKGDMSVVGPRPTILRFFQEHPQIIYSRTLVKPGLTGLWQVKARDQNKTGYEMLQYDFDYFNNLTFINDLKIILQTFKVIIKKEAAF
jgi:lipopolysaccharide/colanic/teichoic acid biosynthesis glycosyltransferase